MKTYATKANAARAARKAVGGTDGEEFMTYQTDDGKWAWEVEQGPTAIEPPKAEKPAPIAPPKPTETGCDLQALFSKGTPGEYAEPPVDASVDEEQTDNEGLDPANFAKPPRDKGAVRRVWDICEDNKDLRRKDVIAMCVAKGINYYTARTQYQAWFKATNDSKPNNNK